MAQREPQGSAAQPVAVVVADDDFAGAPLPRVPHAVIAIWIVRLCAALAPLALGGLIAAWSPLVGAVVVFAFAFVHVGLTIVCAGVVRLGADAAGLHPLDRAGHPGFFAVLDDVCDRMGVARLERVYLTNRASAENRRVEGASTLSFGWPLLTSSTVSEFLTTLAHETAHHSANDLSDSERLADEELEKLSDLKPVFFPWSPLAARLRLWSTADSYRRSRLAEHSADFWGAAVAGPGQTRSSLWTDGRTIHLWRLVVDDVELLRSAGFRPRSIYGLLREGWRLAEELHYFPAEPSACRPEDATTHPPDDVRAAVADAGVAGLAHRPIDERGAQVMFEQVEHLERDLGDLYFSGPERVVVVDDHQLWPLFAEHLPARVRHSFAIAFQQPIDANVDAEALLTLSGAWLAAGKRLFDADGHDVTAALLARALDLALVEGTLVGRRSFGVPRTILVDGCEEAVASVVDALLQGVLWEEVLGSFVAEGEPECGHVCGRWCSSDTEDVVDVEDTQELPFVSP
ncbi:MAG: M48 family metallopeptidase [Deltaproteobacteria bacterium]|nr:M48 family metallopeptidase [Deltaproteobacteria bacterium]